MFYGRWMGMEIIVINNGAVALGTEVSERGLGKDPFSKGFSPIIITVKFFILS